MRDADCGFTLRSRRRSIRRHPAGVRRDLHQAFRPAGIGIGISTYVGRRIVATKYTLLVLIGAAFPAQPFEIDGVSGWMKSDAWDIDARPPASSKSAALRPLNRKAPPNDEQRQMLQSVLADRFALRFHREMKQQPVYFLGRNRTPLQLKDAKVKDGFSWVDSPHGGMIVGDGVAGENVSMPALAERSNPAKPLSRRL